MAAGKEGREESEEKKNGVKERGESNDLRAGFQIALILKWKRRN